MGVSEPKKSRILPILVMAILFVIACILQQTDNLVSNWNISKLMALTAQFIFFGILAYWIVTVINRVSDKKIRAGLVATIVLMSLVLLLKLIKYNVIYDATATRYFWYSYYIPQCISPVVLLLTVLNMGRKSEKPLSKYWNLLFIPAILLIFFVFTNDLHEQVFSFAQGLEYANEIYKWEWGYYFILGWISGLYLVNGILLFIKCRISHCRKKAWIPFILFIWCLACCVLRELFNPAFIKMPETVVFSVVIVCESLIRIGFIPSNTEYVLFFDAADVSAVIMDKDFCAELSSKSAPKITHEQALTAFRNGEIALTKDLSLKAKQIRGGEVFWTEDSSIINKINDRLAEINATLEEEIDLISAENQLKEQRSKIEKQNNLYQDVFRIACPHLEKIKKCFAEAVTEKEKDDALRLAVVYGVFLKRRSNLIIMENEQRISLSELVYSLRESLDALDFYGVHSSMIANVEGELSIEKVEFIYDFFEDCIERALFGLSACLIRLSQNGKDLSCRIALDSVKARLSKNWRKADCQKYNAVLSTIRSDETLYITLTLKNAKEGVNE